MKKNLRKIPDFITEKLKSLPQYVIVAEALSYSADSLRGGALAHLGVTLTIGGELVLPDERPIPPRTSGKVSRWNIDGRVIKRTDLEMETFYITFETPNFGDAIKYGTHMVTWERERYPRQYLPAHLNAIRIRAADHQLGSPNYLFAFEVEEVLDQNAATFHDRLLDCLNLLQENIGAVDVQKAGASMDDYISTLALGWEVLPPGSKETTLARLFRGSNNPPSIVDRQTASERYDFFKKLGAQQFLSGTSGFQRYFGAMVRSDIVVFENLRYGNACYILFEDWIKLSQKNRLDLIAGVFGPSGRDFERVIHRDGWKEKVEKIVAERLKTQEKRSA